MHARESIDQVAKRRIWKCASAISILRPGRAAAFVVTRNERWSKRLLLLLKSGREFYPRGDNARLIMRCIRNRSASAAAAVLWEEISRLGAEWNSRMHTHVAVMECDYYYGDATRLIGNWQKIWKRMTCGAVNCSTCCSARVKREKETLAFGLARERKDGN